MFSINSLQNILFLDIETVPQHPDFNNMDENWKKLWESKSNSLKKQEEDTPETLYNRAGIYAEFGKIICISCGFFRYEGGEISFRLKSFYGDDEKILLKDFTETLIKHFNKQDHLLCAHNGKEFDFPYLCRRLIINDLPIPEILNIAGKKPWEVKHVDTMELWKFGDYKSYTSLNLLANVLGVPTPKDDIDGSMVREVYYNENDIERIAVYCQKDVLTTAQILLRFSGQNLLKDEQIKFS